MTSVLARAVRILEAFTPQEPHLSVSDIARRAGLHVATASRLVRSLTELGLLTRTADGVEIGMRLWELAQRASPALSMREAAMPFLEDLHAGVGHHVQLGVLDGTDVLFVERLSAARAVVTVTTVAGRLPLHASSAGLVLLAWAGRDLQERVLTGPLRSYTPHTVTAPERLRVMLAGIRRQGFAVCPGHLHADATGVAVPLRRGGAVIAALSVVVPNDRHATTTIPALLTTARGIARALGSSLIR